MEASVRIMLISLILFGAIASCNALIARDRMLKKNPSGTRLHFINPLDLFSVPSAVPDSQSAAQAFDTAFTTTFASRITGVVIGNIVAGAAVKVGSDLLRNKLGDKKKEAEEKEREKLASQKSVTIPGDAWAKLLACVVIDLIGDTSFAIPGIGEAEDVAWSPISAFAVKALFGSNVIAGLDFVKEILPGTDFIPVACLAWSLTYLFPGNPVAAAIGLPDPGKFDNGKNKSKKK